MSQSIRKLGNVGFPLLLLVFSIAYTVTGFSLGPLIVDGKLSPSFFPMILGILAIGLSLVLTWRSLQIAEQTTDSEKPTGVDRFRVILIIASTAAFIMVFQRIGYLFSAPAYVLSIILLFSDRKNIIPKMVIAIVTALLAYFMFTTGFNVRLPELLG